MLTALLLGALFCWGNNEVKAYIYDNIQIDIEGTFFQINSDENDLILKNESRINAPNIENDVSPKKIKEETIKKQEKTHNVITSTINVSTYNYHPGARLEIRNLPDKITVFAANKIINALKSIEMRKDNYTVDGELTDVNNMYGLNISYTYCNDGASEFNTLLDMLQGTGKTGSSSFKKGYGLFYTKDKTLPYTDDYYWAIGNIYTQEGTALRKLAVENTGQVYLDYVRTNFANIPDVTFKVSPVNIYVQTKSILNFKKGIIDADKVFIDKTSSAQIGNLTANELHNSGTYKGGILHLTTFENEGKINMESIITIEKGETINGDITCRSIKISDTVDKKTGEIVQNGTLTATKDFLITKGTLKSLGKINVNTMHLKDSQNAHSFNQNMQISGNIFLKNKIQNLSAGINDRDAINKAQMELLIRNKLNNSGKTYYAGTGISLDNNNAVSLANAAAYTTNDKNRVSLGETTKTKLKKIKAGFITEKSKDLVNGSQLYSIQQSIAGFADRIKTNKNQMENLKSSINSKKEELSGIQKNLNTIKGNKLNQDMSNLTTDGEAVIKNQVKKAIQKFQKDMDVSTVQANIQEAKVSDAIEAKSTESYEPSIMLADAPIEAANEPVNAVSSISKEDVAAKADLTQTKVNLEKKATLDTMDVSAYTKQLSKGLTTGESAYHTIQKAKEDRLVQAKENTLTVGANGAETKIDASKKNWTGISVNEKEAGSIANVGYVNQTLSMESSYDRLSLMKKDLEKDTNKGIAKAAAMAALKPIGNDEEDKVSFAIGYGHYKDGNAAAIGTFFRPSQDILIHLDVTAGAGKPSMNTGVSFKVGKGSSYASMTREELAAENAAMKNQAEKQAERIQTQKEKIEHLESVMQSIRF